MKITVTAERATTSPVDPLFFAHFIELGFGRQVEGMWAQMLFNRSFEAVPPYRGIHWYWLQRTATDNLSKEEWWHSGYEEQPWFLVPGNNQAEWRTVESTGFRRGEWSGWLSNKHPDQWAGVAQSRIYLRRGMAYDFEGMLRSPEFMWDWGHPKRAGKPVELRIYRTDDWTKPLIRREISGLSGVYPESPFKARLENGDFEGWATFSIWTPPQSELNLDDVSLMPADHIEGWRAEVIEASRRIRPALIRWPGGCFASFYNWRDGIGPIEERHPREAAFWGGLIDNDVGTAEMARFCQLVGAESFICVNMLTGTAGDAADWVAYCNAPTTHPMGALRAAHGYPKPFGITYWELDNEAGRRFGPEEYARRSVEYSRAMKAVDPAIKTVMIIYEPYRPFAKQMLEIAGRDIDFVTDRNNIEDQLNEDVAWLRDFNQRNGTQLRLTNTEWLAPTTDVPIKPDLINFQAATRDDTLQNRQIRWRYAMNVARQLLLFQRIGGDLAWTNFNNFANTWGQNVIECPKEGVFLSAPGMVYELFSSAQVGWPLVHRQSEPHDPEIVFQAATGRDGKQFILHVLNYKSVPQELCVNLDQVDLHHGTLQGIWLVGQNLAAHLTADERTAVRRVAATIPVNDSQARIIVPPFSVGQFLHVEASK